MDEYTQVYLKLLYLRETVAVHHNGHNAVKDFVAGRLVDQSNQIKSNPVA